MKITLDVGPTRKCRFTFGLRRIRLCSCRAFIGKRQNFSGGLQQHVVLRHITKWGLIGFAAFSVSSGYCRLDETIAQIATRYGDETSKKPGNNSPADFVKSYYFRDNIMTVYFRNGASVAESYSKKGLYRADEIDEILQANAEGSQWKVVSQSPALMQRLDGGAVASYDIGHNFLLVAKSDFYQDWQNFLKQKQTPIKPF